MLTRAGAVSPAARRRAPEGLLLRAGRAGAPPGRRVFASGGRGECVTGAAARKGLFFCLYVALFHGEAVDLRMLQGWQDRPWHKQRAYRP